MDEDTRSDEITQEHLDATEAEAAWTDTVEQDERTQGGVQDQLQQGAADVL